MWQPDLLDSNQRVGQLVASQKAAGPHSVICLLDPPRNAIAAESYQQAQRNIIKLYDLVPRFSPFVVGLQEDFWGAYEERLSKSALEDENGFGIAEALARADPPPTVVRLKNEEFLRTYKGLEAEAISFMSDAASFSQQLTSTYHTAERQLFSTALADFIAKVNQFRVEKDSAVRSYIQEIVRVAESTGISLNEEQYQGLAFYQAMRTLEAELEESAVRDERNRLAEEIQAASTPDSINPRSAWELFLYSRSKARDREALEDEISRLEDMLKQLNVLEPPPSVIQKACQLASERCMIDMRLVSEEDKSKLLGDAGDLVSNLLELGTIMGVNTAKYEKLEKAVQHARTHRRLETLAGDSMAKLIDETLLRLEDEIIERLAQSEVERELIRLRPTLIFLESLSRYQIAHDEHLRRVITSLSFLELCAKFEDLGLELPANCSERAELLDKRFSPVRDYYDLTILRGKDMARTLVSAMEKNEVTKGLLYCDGYLYSMIERWFETKNISYSFFFPKW